MIDWGLVLILTWLGLMWLRGAYRVFVYVPGETEEEWKRTRGQTRILSLAILGTSLVYISANYIHGVCS